MANWVSNQIRVTGPKEQLEKLRLYVKSDQQSFDFEKIISSPESGKWNARDPEVIESDRGLILNFHTKWAAPTRIYEELSRLFPELEFTVFVFEEMLNFCGLLLYRRGALAEQKLKYDIGELVDSNNGKRTDFYLDKVGNSVFQFKFCESDKNNTSGAEIVARAAELLSADRSIRKTQLIGETLAAGEFGYLYYVVGSAGPLLVVQVDVRLGAQQTFEIGKALAPLGCKIHVSHILIDNRCGKITVHNIEYLDLAAHMDETHPHKTYLDIVDAWACVDDTENAVAFAEFLEKTGIPEWMPES